MLLYKCQLSGPVGSAMFVSIKHKQINAKVHKSGSAIISRRWREKYRKGNWGEGSLFVGGFVAICCVLIHWGKFLLNKIPWLCYYPAGGGSVLLDV